MDDAHLHRIAQVEQRHEQLIAKLQAIEDKFDTKLDMILMQITKIAVLEVNLSNNTAATDRAFHAIANCEHRITDVEHFRARIEGMTKLAWILWGSISAVVVGLIIKSL
jgi:hypothetical protein